MSTASGFPVDPFQVGEYPVETAIVSYAEGRISYTITRTTNPTCIKCGKPATAVTFAWVNANGIDTVTGMCKACQSCTPTHWMFYCHGPKTEAARRRNRV